MHVMSFRNGLPCLCSFSFFPLVTLFIRRMNQYDVSTYAHGHGLVSSGQSLELKQREKNCQAKLRSGSYMNGQCWDLLDDVIKQSGGPGKPKV